MKKVGRAPTGVALAMLVMAAVLRPVRAEEPPRSSRPVVALVLEGGGALGFAHVGVIKIIEEMGIPVDIVVGTSMGALVGGFYACGYDAAGLRDIVLDIDWVDIFIERRSSVEDRYRRRVNRSLYFYNLNFSKDGLDVPNGLLAGRKMLHVFDRKTLGVPTPVDFDSLPRRYRAMAVDLRTGALVTLAGGSLSDAMRASMSVPGFFSPHVVDGMELVDGGVLDNLSGSTARALGADLIIAVDLPGGIVSLDGLDMNSMYPVTRSLEIMFRSSVLRQLDGADLVVSVDLSGCKAIEFWKAEEIMKRGEDAAVASRPSLEAFKARLDGAPLREPIAPLAPPEPIRRIRAIGGTLKDRAQVDALFGPMLGTVPDESLIEEAIGILEGRGVYDFVRIRRTEADSVPTLEIELRRRPSYGHSFRLGMEYASTYAESITSAAGLFSSALFRDLTTEGSLLRISLGLLDSVTFEASFQQPVAGTAFIEGSFAISQEAETVIVDSDIGYRLETKATSVGIAVGANPAAYAEVSAGLSYEWVTTDGFPGILAGAGLDATPMARLEASVSRLDSPIFPTDGLSFLLEYDRSLLSPAGSRPFNTLSAEGLIMTSFDAPVTAAAWIRAATDFSESADGAAAAPISHKPDLASRQFFPGPLEIRERIGSHVAGVGCEVKVQLNWALRAVGSPTFILVQASAGTALQDADDFRSLSDFIHLNSAVGLGVRINDGFGASLRLGASIGFDGDPRPFIAVDLGSLRD